MSIPLIALVLLLSNSLPLQAISLAQSSASEAFCNPSRLGRRNNARRSFSENKARSSFIGPLQRQNDQYRLNNFGNSRIHSMTPTYHDVTSTTTLSPRHTMHKIRHFMRIKWSQVLRLFRTLTIASILLFPSIASSSSSSSSYYLQGNPHQPTQLHRQQQQSEISIQTQQSLPYSSNNNRNINTVRSRRQYPQTNRYIQQRNKKSTTTAISQTQKVKRTTLLIMLLTFALSSHRASLRKSKIIRTITPFGHIRNTSLLGNGVSVIRLCMALKFDSGTEAKVFLNKLYLEKKELYTKISSQDYNVHVSSSSSESQSRLTAGASNFRQQALGVYLSNVASTFLQNLKCIKYGNVESVRVPFVEDAVKEFRRVVTEERQIFALVTDDANQKKKKGVDSSLEHKKKRSDNDSNEKKSGYYVLATILLSIKGDRTSVPLPFGIIRQRDVGRALSRICTDATVEDCLVASEINWAPNIDVPDLITGDGFDDSILLSGEDVLKACPDLVALT